MRGKEIGDLLRDFIFFALRFVVLVSLVGVVGWLAFEPYADVSYQLWWRITAFGILISYIADALKEAHAQLSSRTGKRKKVGRHR